MHASRMPAKRMLRSISGALAAIFLAVGIAAAHDTWLLADSGETEIGKPVLLSLTSGDGFPLDETAIDPVRVVRATVRVGGAEARLPAPQTAAHALRYSWTPKSEGLAAVAIELAPKTLVLAPDKLEEYLGEIDATPKLRAEWKALDGKRKWIESYSKHAKTFVRVGTRAADSSWARALGLGLELVPERDPASLRTGDAIGILVLRNGKPLADFAVGAIHEGSDKAAFARTDSSGRARVTLGSAGKWLLNGTLIRRSANPKLTWESDFTTLTLRVH